MNEVSAVWCFLIKRCRWIQIFLKKITIQVAVLISEFNSSRTLNILSLYIFSIWNKRWVSGAIKVILQSIIIHEISLFGLWFLWAPYVAAFQEIWQRCFKYYSKNDEVLQPNQVFQCFYVAISRRWNLKEF